MISIVKTQETREGVQFRIWNGTEFKFAHKDFNNYFYIKTDDYDSYKEEFYSKFTFCIEKIEYVGQFTKISLSNNFMRFKVKGWWDERMVSTFEADIKANKRYLLDNKITLNNENLPYAFYDIETDDRNPLVKDDYGNVVPQSRILSYARVNHKGEHIYFQLASETDEAEKMLLQQIVKDLSNFGIISGWFSERFDMPYIKGRCDALGISYQILDYVNHLDYKEVFSKYDKKSRPSNSLNAISNEVLNESKIDQAKGNGAIYNTWKNNPEHLMKYNIKDSNLIYKINKKIMFIEIAMAAANLNKCHVRNTMNNTDSGDFLLLRAYKKAGIIMTSKPTKAEKLERLKRGKIGGGYTKCFIPGFYEEAHVWDFASLYPSIIEKWNIDPMTFVDTVDPLNAKDVDKNEFIVTPDDFENYHHRNRIYKKKKGVIPQVVTELTKERNKIKYDMNKYKWEKLENGKPNPDYDPIKYKQLYLHQYAIKTVNNCFHPKTMILTKAGIKNIKDLELGEEVLSINPKTLKTEYKKVIALHNEDYNGELYKIENTRTKLRVTPEHKFFVYDKRINDYKFMKIKDVIRQRHLLPVANHEQHFTKYLYFDELFAVEDSLLLIKYEQDLRLFNSELEKYGVKAIKYRKSSRADGYKYACLLDISSEKIKELSNLGYDLFWNKQNNTKILPVRFDNTAFSEMIGWFISEGSHSKQSFRINISQDKKDNRKLIIETLDKLKISYRITKRGFTFNSYLLYKFLIDNFGENSYTKKCPNRFFDILDVKSMWKTLDLGDGTVNRGRYTTKSKQLAEDLLILLNMFGYKTRLKLDTSNSWRLYFNKKTPGEKHSLSHKILTKENYEGKVYNLTVEDNHTLLAAEYKSNRNLGFVWTSQSIYGTLAFPASRYYSWEVADSVTTCARATIKECYKKLKEWGCGALGGDTDSIFVDLKGQDKSAIDKKFVTFLEEWAQQWGTPYKRLIFEHEKVYKPFLFVKKKNYAYIDHDKVKIVGLEAIKSDTNPKAAEIQRELITQILKSEYNPSEWETEIETLYNTVFDQELSPKELVLTKALTKMPSEYEGFVIAKSTGKPKVKADGTLQKKSIPAHVKLATRLLAQGVDLYPGSKIHFIVIKTKPNLAISLEEYAKGEGVFITKYKKDDNFHFEFEGGYDATYYWTRIITPFMKVLHVYNKGLPDWNWGLTPSALNKILSKLSDDNE